MAKRQYSISSILGGQQPTEIFAGEGQFLYSRAIDPDTSRIFSTQGTASSGLIAPVGFAGPATGGETVDDRVVAIVRQNRTQNDLIFAVLKNGKIKSYEVTGELLVGESSIGQVTGSNAEGAFVYKDFLYITGTGASADDISRYGPLSGSASISNGVWTGSTLGSQTALADHDMAGDFPKHWGHVHTDGQAYFADFVNGQGVLHSIQTDTGGSDDGTEYNVLDLPFGYRITDIESYGTDLVIAAVQTTSSDMIEGEAALFLWDTTNDVSFYRQVSVPAPFISALLNKGGIIYVWYGFSADASEGTMVGTYTGGYNVNMIDFHDTGRLPLAGAVAAYGDRITYANDKEVYALGYKNPKVGSRTARHSIGQSSEASGSSYINALAYVSQPSGAEPIVVIGTNESIEQTRTLNSSVSGSIWRSELINVGKRFKINKIAIPLDFGVGSSTQVQVRIYYDNSNTTVQLNDINDSSFENGARRIVYKEREISEAGSGGAANYTPYYNFFIEFTINSNNAIMLPIEIEVDTIDD